MDINRIRSQVKTELIGSELLFFNSLRSTNDTAHRMIDHGERQEGCIILSETQTRGRGLLNRRWRSPSGLGLWLSIILFPDISSRSLPQMSLVFALSTARAVSEAAGIDVLVKWSNDLISGDLKIGGLLVESHTQGEKTKQAVVGIGINVNQPAEYFEEQKLTEATSLRLRTGKEADREKLFLDCVRTWDEDYRKFAASGFAAFKDEWEKRDYLAGRELTVIDSDGQKTGRAAGLDDSGCLLLDIMGGKRITAVPGKTTIRLR